MSVNAASVERWESSAYRGRGNPAVTPVGEHMIIEQKSPARTNRSSISEAIR